MKEIMISTRDEGQKLHKFLKKYFREASSGFLYKMLRKKQITLNKKKADGQEVLREADRIQVFFSDETFAKMQGLDEVRRTYASLKELPHDLDVIYEDEQILLINKPAGILSQKAEEDDISINEMILSYLIEKGELSLEQYQSFHPSIANRLDRNTSGLLLAGKTLEGQQKLALDMKERTAEKRYRCLVGGIVKDAGELQGYLLKDEESNTVRILDKPEKGAKEIRTAFRPLQRGKELTLLEVELITGRSHQIRAHLASMGHPILGDPKYGDMRWNQKIEKKYGVKGQLLHAYSITFSDGRSFSVPEPEVFHQILQWR